MRFKSWHDALFLVLSILILSNSFQIKKLQEEVGGMTAVLRALGYITVD